MFCEYDVELFRLFTYCRQENAIVSNHIHRTWEGYFRGGLYLTQFKRGFFDRVKEIKGWCLRPITDLAETW